MKNDLGQYQLKEQQSKQKDLQSAYDTQQEAYADLQEQATIWNRTQNILRNPQEYSNPNDKYFALGAAGVHQDIIAKIAGQTRNKQLYERTIEKAPYTAGALGVAELGGSPGFQERTLNQSLTQRDQQDNTIATPEVLRNIESTGDIAQAAQTTANANLLQQQTGAANSVIGQFETIMSTFPDTAIANNPTLKRQRALMLAKVLGIDEKYTFLLETLNEQQLKQAALGIANVDPSVQRQEAGLPAFEPQKPTAATLTPEQKGRADYEEAKSAFDTSLGYLPEGEEKERLRKIGYESIAKKLGQISDPTTTGSDSVTTVDKDLYDGFVNIFSSLVNIGFAENESSEYGIFATVVSLNNILKANKTLEGDPTTLAKRFIAQLGDAIASVGTENQTAVQKSLAHLVQNDAALQNVIVRGLQISAAKGGGAITLKELGMTDEQIAQFAFINHKYK